MNIYTLGYSGFTVNEFVDALLSRKVSTVIDVRSLPFSRHNPEYDKPEISRTLSAAGIGYQSCPEEFGARQTNIEFYHPDGYMDFEVFAQSPQFIGGVKGLLECRNVCALMCKEIDPLECHRAVLVARALHKMGARVLHIVPDAEDMTHEELESRLLDAYCSGWKGDMFTSPEEYLTEAYRLCNAKIGWRLEAR